MLLTQLHFEQKNPIIKNKLFSIKSKYLLVIFGYWNFI